MEKQVEGIPSERNCTEQKHGGEKGLGVLGNSRALRVELRVCGLREG